MGSILNLIFFSVQRWDVLALRPMLQLLRDPHVRNIEWGCLVHLNSIRFTEDSIAHRYSLWPLWLGARGFRLIAGQWNAKPHRTLLLASDRTRRYLALGIPLYKIELLLLNYRKSFVLYLQGAYVLFWFLTVENCHFNAGPQSLAESCINNAPVWSLHKSLIRNSIPCNPSLKKYPSTPPSLTRYSNVRLSASFLFQLRSIESIPQNGQSEPNQTPETCPLPKILPHTRLDFATFTLIHHLRLLWRPPRVRPFLPFTFSPAISLSHHTNKPPASK